MGEEDEDVRSRLHCGRLAPRRSPSLDAVEWNNQTRIAALSTHTSRFIHRSSFRSTLFFTAPYSTALHCLPAYTVEAYSTREMVTLYSDARTAE